MREFNIDEFFKEIDEKQQEVNERAYKLFRGKGRKARVRPRDEDEKRCLDIICREKWMRAVEEGKVRYINDREMDYFVD
ncbi:MULTISPECIES: hypothetical protein [Aneurinibacillus]|jgi:hypothetical protein|uniref:Uncharacterized protein n=1 Tax=Aneurinibacillus danicus TaxID=267746 RepID=A0A511V404_9BACL|nr:MULTISPECIES: hypothetical protein [Aneurinibacillus]AMA73337.1 hypothetical protein ACH33_11050 [Aneurinibacillus sp. XH2]GEN33655.1 hypothetical protein ADA01nite_11150 [Aneurinibacillus danicus]